ncbi:MAG: SurA N-terminal domain-containing protein [Rikenellaceae bacterium]|jgi:peptidyl-prolyl cis-trans isomerase D|nr:SurA N-terminal domain-containing protein [Rikenellaceae bacterium]
MATLNTLRTKGGWIVTLVIAIALLAFLIGDLAGNNSIFGAGEKVGSIAGNKISLMDYSQKIDELTTIQTVLSNGQALSSEAQDQLRNDAWSVMQNEIVFFPGLEKMGIEVTEDEMIDRMYGDNISPILLNSGLFNNPSTGEFDKETLQNFVFSYQLDPTGQMAILWKYIQDQVRQNALVEKYVALMQGMPFVNDAEAQAGADRSNTYYNAGYVVQPYTSIADSLVKVSDSEIRTYYNAHKNSYKQTASRDVEYVVFEVTPSVQDYADAKTLIEQMSAEFAQSDNLQQYVTLNSQQAFDPTYYTREQLPTELADYVFAADRPAIYGPHLEGNVYSAVRVSDMRSFPDTIGFRQMIFSPGIEALADSVFTVVKNGGDFAALAAQYSEIPASSVDAGRISTQGIPIEIGEQIYNNNDRFVKIVESNGILILDLYYRGPVSPKVQLAQLIYNVEPSSVTQQAAYAKASGFYTATAGLSDNFNKIAADSAYAKRVARIQAGQTQVSGMENGREMIRWAFNAKPGAISNIMEIDNNYVIADLTAVSEYGYTPVEQLKTMITSELITEKKYAMLAEKMTGASSLSALAQSLSLSASTFESLNYSNLYIPEISGIDPALLGAVCGGVAEGQLSKPIQGAAGVYVVELTSTRVEDQITVDMEKTRLQAQAEYNFPTRLFQALTAKSDVIDGRAKYF